MSASVPPQTPSGQIPSGQTPSGQPPAAQPAAAGADPSMEDILASIRRILSEDEAGKPAEPAAAAPPAAAPEAEDVFALDESMMVAEPAAPPPPAPQPAASQDDMAALLASFDAPGEPLEVVPVPPAPAPAPAVLPIAAPMAPPVPDRLIAPEAEAATASSVGSLLRTLDSTRQAAATQLYRGGPTLEDMVREEMRPILKEWLDAHLPPMVERLVRAEIERLVGRAVG